MNDKMLNQSGIEFSITLYISSANVLYWMSCCLTLEPCATSKWTIQHYVERSSTGKFNFKGFGIPQIKHVVIDLL